MKQVCSFDPAAYLRIRLPWLFAVLLASLALDGVLLFGWIGDEPATAEAQYALNIGLSFLALVNLAVLKAWPLHRFWRTRRQRARSEVRIEADRVVHYLFHSSMTGRQVASAREGLVSAYGRDEYVSADTISVLQVRRIVRRRNGSLMIDGRMECESVNEGWEESSEEREGPISKPLRRHVIPAYYEQMPLITEALCRLKADGTDPGSSTSRSGQTEN